ncbi:MAG: hypothetical protein OEQ13_05420, partial [Acidobacteriota bacterium]|nr:hypothetical protein [Acidobacteriota bacterium]
MKKSMKAGLLAAGLVAMAGSALALTYPLDAYERTGIRRLQAYSMILDGRMPGSLAIQPGARL